MSVLRATECSVHELPCEVPDIYTFGNCRSKVQGNLDQISKKPQAGHLKAHQIQVWYHCIKIDKRFSKFWLNVLTVTGTKHPSLVTSSQQVKEI